MTYTAVSKPTDTYDSVYNIQGNSVPSKVNNQRDQEIAEFVINAIQIFLEKHCQSSKIEFISLSRRPITHKTCERALELIKLFDDRIVLKRWNVETSHYCHEVRAGNNHSSSGYPMSRPPQLTMLEISMLAYDALRRHSESLRLNGENLGLEEVPVHNPYECTVEHPFHEIDLKYTSQSKLLNPSRKETLEKTCIDHCTIF